MDLHKARFFIVVLKIYFDTNLKIILLDRQNSYVRILNIIK